MTFMLVLSGAVIAAIILSGRAKNMGANDWLTVAVALIGVNLCRGGNWLVGGGVIAAAMAWSGSKILGIHKAGRQDHSRAQPAPDAQELEQARSLLGVGKDADRAAINAAWRSHLTAHHPDRGGDEKLARQINRARDLLLEAAQTAHH